MRQDHLLMSVLFTLAILLAFGAGAVQAQTPDGETPAVEEICDPFSGAAFGLCNAYCEAMDCHLNRPDDPGAEPPFPSASETACLKVLNNWMKFMYPEPLPCEADECPQGTLGCPCNDDGTCNEGEGECNDQNTCEEGT